MYLPKIKKLLIKLLSVSLFLCFSVSSFAADFIVPNSSGEPIVIDISTLNLSDGIDVSIGEFTDQPRSYRDSNIKSIAIFPPAASNSEKTIQIRAGSTTITKTVSFRSSPDGDLRSSLLPGLKEGRAGNTVTKISDGRIVLIGGGKSLADQPLNSLEVFDPETGKNDFLKIPNNSKKALLQIARSQHTATYLGITNSPVGMIPAPAEQILLVGGFSGTGQLTNSIEIVEISVGTNQAVSTLLNGKNAKLKKSRIDHSASLLPDGRVLIIGGQGHINKTTLGALNSIEIFDPVLKTVQSSPFLLGTPRLLHTATTLQDGSILIAGGFTNENSTSFGLGPATNKAELIDTKNFTIKQVGTLETAVGGHTATLLTNGQVLITGGTTDLFAGTTSDSVRGLSVSSIQFYDNASQAFNFVTDKSSGGNLDLQISRFLHQTILLPNGNVLVIGGLSINQAPNTQNFVNTPVSRIEILAPDFTLSSSNSLKVDQKSVLETSTGRVQPIAVLVTPKNKTQGFLSSSDVNKFVNCAVYLAGGFTNGFGKLPSKSSEFLQIESNIGIEGRQIKLTPEAVIQGSYLSDFFVEIDKFSVIPSLKVQPQTLNLSSSNNFLANTKVLSTNNQIVLLKAEVNDPNGSVIVSPSLFQVGESITISRKDSSVQGEFEVNIIPIDNTTNFIPAKIKVNVSDSSKPFLSTIPAYGISFSTEQGSENNSQMIQVKVFSQDGSTEFSSVPETTQVTAVISDSSVANLGGVGVSSVTGNLLTQFNVNAVKPGKTNINFSINFPDILGVSIPLQISGAPTFSNNPIDLSTLSALSLNNGVQISGVMLISPFSISLNDFNLSSNSPLFPIYVPINLQSSIDNSASLGSFTVRPIFGIDLLTALPRTFVNNDETAFKTPLTAEPLAIGGLVSSDLTVAPVAILASDDGIRAFAFIKDNQNLIGPLAKISNASGVKDLKLFEFGSNPVQPKLTLLRGSMISLIDLDSGNVESSAALSADGSELELTEIDGQTAAVVSVGIKGVDLVFPVTDAEPRVENSHSSVNVKHIAVIKKLGDSTGPFVAAYDDSGIISIRNLVNVNAAVQTIDTGSKKFTKIAYAGKFLVNNKSTDVLICAGERSVTLFDLNNLTNIPFNEDLKIKNKIEDLLVINGTAYVALGDAGILALSVGGLIDNNKQAVITTFTKNKLTVIKSNGRETFITKPLNAKKLANATPFLLSSGVNNNLTVIRVSP